MILSYPNKTKESTFLSWMVVFYVLFSLSPEIPPIDLRLFLNDLSQPDVLSWLYSQLLADIFIFVVTKEACSRIEDKITKAIFYAIAINSLFSALFAVLFGYGTSLFLALTRNSFTLAAMYYAYFHLSKKK